MDCQLRSAQEQDKPVRPPHKLCIAAFKKDIEVSSFYRRGHQNKWAAGRSLKYLLGMRKISGRQRTSLSGLRSARHF